jgi:hypothetical protein
VDRNFSTCLFKPLLSIQVAFNLISTYISLIDNSNKLRCGFDFYLKNVILKVISTSGNFMGNCWSLSSLDWIKCNVDGADCGTPNFIACGVSFRGNNTLFLGCFKN